MTNFFRLNDADAKVSRTMLRAAGECYTLIRNVPADQRKSRAAVRLDICLDWMVTIANFMSGFENAERNEDLDAECDRIEAEAAALVNLPDDYEVDTAALRKAVDEMCKSLRVIACEGGSHYSYAHAAYCTLSSEPSKLLK